MLYEVITPFNTDTFCQAWNQWKDYKKTQYNFAYKSQLSEQTALHKLAQLANDSETQAIQIIANSIANGWKGLFTNQNIYTNGSRKSTEATTNEELAAMFARKYAANN